MPVTICRGDRRSGSRRGAQEEFSSGQPTFAAASGDDLRTLHRRLRLRQTSPSKACAGARYGPASRPNGKPRPAAVHWAGGRAWPQSR
jgi:hypothetical protein